MNIIMNYIISLTNLYGIVEEQQIVDAYNMHHDEAITDLGVIDYLLLDSYSIRQEKKRFTQFDLVPEELTEHEIKLKLAMPHYIPEQGEILEYKTVGYQELTKDFIDLVKFLNSQVFQDEKRAYDFAVGIQLMGSIGLELNDVMQIMIEDGVQIENEREFAQIVLYLFRNVRTWMYNGYTQIEFEALPKFTKVKEMKTPKLGRNDLCHCGSGKKYKSCCLNKDKYSI